MTMKARVIRLWAPAILLGGMIVGGFSAFLDAQTPSSASSSATQSLLDKADSLEARGRMDLAVQTWQQVLLMDPKNTAALGGLARAAALNGNATLSKSYVERLRAINPNDPNIARVEKMAAQPAKNSRLDQAAKLAAAGQIAAAMTIYRQVLGTNPPPGDAALAYYETEAATVDGRPHAVAGLRALAEKVPGDSRYQIALGRLLTYDPKTREEGRKILERFPNDLPAVEGLRQALFWDAANPAVAPEIRTYLAAHPDPQLALALETAPKPSAPVESATAPTPTPKTDQTDASRPAPPVESATAPSPTPASGADTFDARARTSAELAAYQSLNAKRINEAETRFKAILAREPGNSNALAGMGYVRMQQGNFLGAISFLEQARQDNPNDKAM